MEREKTFKDYCKEAKKRLKNGFWENYNKDLSEEFKRAEDSGISLSKIHDYYQNKVIDDIKKDKREDEVFYQKVKDILDKEGEVSDVLGRLTDKEYFNTLSYTEKQKYTLNLSEKYLKAIERYNKEKALKIL